MSNQRFHSKYHAPAHWTTPLAGYPDSASDPLFGPSIPFNGDIFINGTLSASRIIARTSYVNVLSAGGYSTTITSVTGNYTMTGNEQTLFVHGSSLSAVVKLPSAASVPSQEYTFKCISTTSVFLSAISSNLIDSTYDSIQLASINSVVHLVSYQSNWWILYQQ